jgi:hypothetical protein
MHRPLTLSALIALAALGAALGLSPSTGAQPVQAASHGFGVDAAGDDEGGGGGGGGTDGKKKRRRCVQEKEDRVQAAGDGGGGEDEEQDEDAPPEFSAEFYKRKFKLDVSADGLDGDQLPISIEKVCRVPKRLARQAAQLAGGDGIALITDRTKVFLVGDGRGDEMEGERGPRLEGEEALGAVDGADTATLKVRLLRNNRWGEDEDGEPVPTFKTRKVKVTD